MFCENDLRKIDSFACVCSFHPDPGERANVIIPDSKFMGPTWDPTWGRQDPGGHHSGHVNLFICDVYLTEPFY